ncbi:hypothetical protein PHMEG_00014336 [Phytophthora megakarya]|uniref:Chromo domain-containing protein n=1 Tax=Phytophthora megakarya TaxID=4795 RepID=A0A225W412_9STRA|nr:hypothetical protein PHMEG_00014336 [Phytophthora megakarya]
MGPVLGRSCYIDDIAHGAPTTEFGKHAIPYISHEISAEGIGAMPKIAKSVQELPFPTTLKGVRSFLGSLNYYHKFIEDFSVVAAALHKLTDEQIKAGRDLPRAKESFEILKRKIVSTPLLRHPDRHKPFVIIPHANRWAACAVLGQEYDGKILPVQRDEDGLAAIMGGGITPREHLHEVAEDMFSGYVMCKPMSSTTAQEVTEAYEERVFQRFGRTAYECRRKRQRDYSYAQACAEDLQRKAKRDRAITQTQKWRALSDRIKAGFSVGDTGPFRIAEVTDDFRVRLKIDDTSYRVNPWVERCSPMPRALFPKRPIVWTEIDDDDDLDAALLPEDSWEVDNTNSEYEFEEILDLRWSKRTRTSKRIREYLVKWRGYDEPDWVPLAQLSCGALLYEFNQGAKARARFRAMQAGDDHPR